MLRYVRYAAAVVFALLALAFVALLVRSYYCFDRLHSPSFARCSFSSASNWGVAVFAVKKSEPLFATDRRWTVFSSASFDNEQMETTAVWSRWGFALYRFDNYLAISAPHWFLALSSLSLAALLAFKRTWRFSLRSVLVATTILAGLLGLAVYLV